MFEQNFVGGEMEIIESRLGTLSDRTIIERTNWTHILWGFFLFLLMIRCEHFPVFL